MSVIEQRIKITTRHESIIPSPACWTDVKMAMHWAAQAREAAGLSNDYDDVIRVDSDDENVIVFWEETT
jgi:hypothetical protein